MRGACPDRRRAFNCLATQYLLTIADMLGHDAEPGRDSTPDGKCRKMSFILELWAFMRERKKYWLVPILMVMALLGGAVVLTQGSAVAPFIYTLF
ncbi:MAG: DUF5989 family protein [Dongiaceae bacterium]